MLVGVLVWVTRVLGRKKLVFGEGVCVIGYARSRTSWEPCVGEVEAFRMGDLDGDGRTVEDLRDLVGFGVVGRLGRLGHQEDEGQFH